MIWVAGRIVPDEALTISVLDRTFEHGLGLFETFRTWKGHPTLLDRHLSRLRRSASDLRLSIEPTALPDAEAVAALLRADGHQGDAVLRITLSGGRSDTEGGVLWMRSASLPPPTREGGAVVGPPARWTTDHLGCGLARFKTLNYWEKRLEYERARSIGRDESLSTSGAGLVGEGTRTNVFAVRDGTLITPGPGNPILCGIMRGLVVERARALCIRVREDVLYEAELAEAEEVFLTNSVRGIIPVGNLGGRELSAPGPLTRRLRDDILPWLESGGTIP